MPDLLIKGVTDEEILLMLHENCWRRMETDLFET